MPLAPETLLASPGCRVTLKALKWSGTSVTVDNLAVATAVRVIAGGAGVVCPAAGAASVIAPSSSNPVVQCGMMASSATDNRRTIRTPCTARNGRCLRAVHGRIPGTYQLAHMPAGGMERRYSNFGSPSGRTAGEAGGLGHVR